MTATTGAAHRIPRQGRPARASAADHRAVVAQALLIRAVEEQLLELFSQGELMGTVHTCVGQEFCPAVIGALLRDGDQVFSNHRCHGHYLAKTRDVLGLVAEVMGRPAGVCSGLGGSQHLCRPGFLSTGVLGGTWPIAAGAALAEKLACGDNVAVVFLGDGALGEGLLYEVLNIAALWQLPMLFVLEDNGYAQSTPRGEALAGAAAARAEAFGIPAARANTWEWPDLLVTAQQVVNRIRGGGGPVFLQVDTYRLRAHSKGDDDRDPDEVAEFERRDPINRLLADGSPDVRELAARAERIVGEAVDSARASLPARRVPEPPPSGKPCWSPASWPEGRFVDLLHAALEDGMRTNPAMVVLGEDIEAPYGGAFKVTQGLSERYPDRVLNTPISEAAIVGIGTGLALRGHVSFVEIMFGDFVTLATDQLVNQACKIAFLRGPDAEPVDVVVRTPMGGRRGYGPTHSQTLDRLVVGNPGLRVVAGNSLVDPRDLVSTLTRGGCGPTVLLENKLLYGARIGAGVPAGFSVELSTGSFPVARVFASDRVDVTLVGYGGMCDHLLAACDTLFTEHDLVAQVLCPSQIYPLDWTPLIELITKGRAIVVAEEGPGFAGFGAELIAQLTEMPAGAEVACRRVVPKEVPIPAARELERDVLPQTEDIVAAAVEVVLGDDH